MRVREVMTQHVVTVHTDTAVPEAMALLARHRITAMPVLDDGELVGMVSEADLLRDRVPGDPRTYRSRADRTPPAPELVCEVMSTPVVSVSEGAHSADAAALMLDYDVRSVPVVDGGQVTGIVSRRDLIRLLVRDSDEVIRDRVQELLDSYAGQRERWAVKVEDGDVTITGDFRDENERHLLGMLVRAVPGVEAVRTGARALAN